MIIELDNRNFNEEIKDNLTLVDFYATWCGPCRMMHPVIEDISKSYPDLKILKVDVDKEENVAREYGIMSIPTIILFKNGNIVEKNVGYTPKEVLDSWIKNNI
jgi:thioredoxin 1